MSTTPFDSGAARILAIEAMNVPAAGHTADRAALITTILDACAEVERLDALPSQLRAVFQDPASDWPTSDRDKLRRIAALLGIEFEEPT